MTLAQIEADIESGEMGEFGKAGQGQDTPARSTFGVMYHQIKRTAWSTPELKKKAKELSERAFALAYK
jgi:hypothetical protein